MQAALYQSSRSRTEQWETDEPTSDSIRDMPVNTIAEVIAALDGIIQRAWEERSCLGYFAALYRRVTRAVKEGIANNQFSDGPRMEKLDVIFASRYLDAMNAHINLDLGVASAEVCPGESIEQLKSDFNMINTVLAAQVAAVESEMSAISPLISSLSLVGLRSETTLINFNIGLARQAAWFNAERLAKEPPVLRDVTLDGLDLAVSIEGRAILYPPFKGDALGKVRGVEEHDVRKVIDILNAGSAGPTGGGST